ncbi:TIGR03435 family protein [Granulicella pectinivorans]|nr:TIGR03435 family protein [Granulicella pectinivorans]
MLLLLECRFSQRSVSMMRNGLARKIVMGTMLAISPAAWAQDASAERLSYDVISVKPNTSGSGGMRIMVTPDGFAAENVSLHMLMSTAFQINSELIVGLPKWSDSDRFDVKAKVAEEDLPALKKMEPKDRIQIVQSIVAERFKVVVHREKREWPTYDLVVAKSGLKMKEAKPDDTYANGIKGPDGKGNGGMMRMGRGTMTGQGIPIENMTRALSSLTQRTVVDKTGLKENYDFELKWTPDDAPAGSTEENGESIFTAVQEQLGLRLDASKGMVETLIVDHVEKPSED